MCRTVSVSVRCELRAISITAHLIILHLHAFLVRAVDRSFLLGDIIAHPVFFLYQKKHTLCRGNYPSLSSALYSWPVHPEDIYKTRSECRGVNDDTKVGSWLQEHKMVFKKAPELAGIWVNLNLMAKKKGLLCDSCHITYQNLFPFAS